MQSGARNGGDGAFLADETAGQAIDDQRLPRRSRLRVVRRGEAGHVARELDDRVLKAATRPQERLPRRPGRRNARVDRIVILVRAPGYHPEAVGLQNAHDVAGVGANPTSSHPSRKQPEHGIELPMREVAGIAVPEQDDLFHGCSPQTAVAQSYVRVVARLRARACPGRCGRITRAESLRSPLLIT